MKIYDSGYYLCLSRGKKQITITPFDDGDMELEADDDDNCVSIFIDLEQQEALRDYLSANIEKHRGEINETKTINET